jgi:predicted lipid carrier protein YhbT
VRMVTTDRRLRGECAMLLILPQREQDPNYLNFMNIVVVSGILQTPLDVIDSGNIHRYGPVVKFSLE